MNEVNVIFYIYIYMHIYIYNERGEDPRCHIIEIEYRNYSTLTLKHEK